ncbi:cAMP-regulated phosphoprotein 19-like [Octodon degus]|uniref:cAMP-regulated phosphoprotein 19-like n=1 Tax=Octodon degus TaxID=10160 RepID=A0A6P6D7D0_OCTDE|nr:cAMP-regulated phosphoprotein 19-like [Octodon degus]
MGDKRTSPEKPEEAKSKVRYPHLGHKSGGSNLLRKQWKKRQKVKYFDSWDHNMAKTKMKNWKLPTVTPGSTKVPRDLIPTPQDLPQWKPLVPSKLVG